MNSQSRSFNSIRNIGSGAVKQIITLTLAFINRTVFVKLLGAEYTGINGLYNNILTVLSLAELGIGTVLTYSLYEPLKNNNKTAVKSLLIYFKRIYRIIACFVAIIGIMIIPFLSFIVNSNIPKNKLYLYYLLFLINSVASYFVIYKTTLIQADQKLYIQNIINMIVLIFQYIIQIIYILIYKDFLGYLVIQIICTLLQNIILNYIANKIYPFLKDKRINILKINNIKIKENIKSMFLYKVAAIIINNTDNILISVIIGTSYVGYYSNYYSLITYMNMFISFIVTGITASLGNLNAEKDEKKSYEIFKNLIYMFNLITTICMTSFFCIVQDFITIWLGKNYLMGTGTVLAICFSFYISNVVNPVWMYRETMGMFKQIKYIMFVTAILNIIFSIILGIKYQVAGIIGATGIARICTIIWYEPLVLYRNKFNKPVMKYFVMQLKYSLLNIICTIISIFICNSLGHGFIWIIAKIVVCTFIVILGHYSIFHKSIEFKWMVEKINNVLKNK